MTSEVRNYYSKIKEVLGNRVLITDNICRLTITFGVVLIIGGLYLMIVNPSGSAQAIQTVASTVNWIPGIPFYIGDLIRNGPALIGLISWITGIDLLFLGMGLWVRHRIARFTALFIFVLASFFQFAQFLTLGIIGSPASIIELLADAAIILFLLFRFDSRTGIPKILPSTT